jgi:aspartate beta-hydroxylase
MNQAASKAQLETRLAEARALVDSNQVLQAESLYSGILKKWPDSLEACVQLARFAMDRADPTRAAPLLERARTLAPNHPQLAVNLGFAYAHSGRPAGACRLMEEITAKFPDFHPAWLLLSQVRDLMGDRAGANKALFQAIRRAQKKGEWVDQGSTPPALLETVLKGVERVRLWRQEVLAQSFESIRAEHGSDELRRVDAALNHYLSQSDAKPADPRQAPRFLFVPDLPATPFLDPALLPWTQRLVQAYPAVRAEALQRLSERPASAVVPGEVSSATSWDGYYFIRHGARVDAHHPPCPATSALVDTLDLCRIRDQAPSACFSWMSPQSRIAARFGLTNSRVVVHLPLIAGGNSGLRVVDGDARTWVEGEPCVFDDSFQHELWNDDAETGAILLMDAWNPHLSPIEQRALGQMIEAISGFESAASIS